MKIIAFEGLDGSGKTSLIKQIRRCLQNQGQEVIVLQGLGSSTIGPTLRQTFLTNQHLTNLTRYCLSFANLFQIQAECLQPHRNTQKIILIDRWLGSNFAYQTYPFASDKHFFLFNFFSQKILKPAITVYGRQRDLNIVLSNQ